MRRCGDVQGRVLRVSLADCPDPGTRARLIAIRTGLTLPRDQVDALVAAGETMIRREAGAIAGFLELGPQPAVIAWRR
jgi:NTE family protein